MASKEILGTTNDMSQDDSRTKRENQMFVVWVEDKTLGNIAYKFFIK